MWSFLSHNKNKHSQLSSAAICYDLYICFAVWQRDDQVMPMGICWAHPMMLSFTLYVLLLLWLTVIWVPAPQRFFSYHVLENSWLRYIMWSSLCCLLNTHTKKVCSVPLLFCFFSQLILHRAYSSQCWWMASYWYKCYRLNNKGSCSIWDFLL